MKVPLVCTRRHAALTYIRTMLRYESHNVVNVASTVLVRRLITVTLSGTCPS